MNIEKMNEVARQVSDIMRLLSSEKRLMILCRLAEGEKSVGELAELLDMRQASLSQQLALLRQKDIVETRRDAQTIYYKVAREDVQGLLEFLHNNYCPIDEETEECGYVST